MSNEVNRPVEDGKYGPDKSVCLACDNWATGTPSTCPFCTYVFDGNDAEWLPTFHLKGLAYLWEEFKAPTGDAIREGVTSGKIKDWLTRFAAIHGEMKEEIRRLKDLDAPEEPQ